jgi:hypothetical protein
MDETILTEDQENQRSASYECASDIMRTNGRAIRPDIDLKWLTHCVAAEVGTLEWFDHQAIKQALADWYKGQAVGPMQGNCIHKCGPVGPLGHCEKCGGGSTY